MQFYGLTMSGKFVGQKLATLPAWAASDEGRMVYAEDVDKYYYGDNAEWVEMIGDVSSLDGDHLDIDWEPSYYTPNASIAEAADVDDLAAHLKGIDTTLATLGASAAAGGSIDYTLYDEQLVSPSTAVNQMAFFAKESTAGTTTMPYFRPESNGTTIRLLIGDASSKFWMYRNGTAPGFVIDSTVTDKVIAIKGGGGTNCYNVDGGNLSQAYGTGVHAWGHVHGAGTHTHPFTGTITGTAASHAHSISTDTDTLAYGGSNVGVGSYQLTTTGHNHTGSTGNNSASVTGTSSGTATASSGNTADNTTYRPYAAVGTLQYPDI